MGGRSLTMPLRDHFHPPLKKKHSWDQLHGLWPGVIVLDLNRKLPTRYLAAPTIHLGSLAQIDVVAFDYESTDSGEFQTSQDEGGVATAVWAPPKPTLDIATELVGQDEYEVRVYDTEHDRRLVAAIEIVSPSNKDRPEFRGVFTSKCASLLRQHVSVAIIDVVTERHANLYAELLNLVDQVDPTLGEKPPGIYAAACRWTGKKGTGRLQTWSHALSIGQPLPILPLWLADNFAVALDLEATYEETCRSFRMQ
jgi:Protein of unknown function (DUF4058)